MLCSVTCMSNTNTNTTQAINAELDSINDSLKGIVTRLALLSENVSEEDAALLVEAAFIVAAATEDINNLTPKEES